MYKPRSMPPLLKPPLKDGQNIYVFKFGTIKLGVNCNDRQHHDLLKYNT